MLAQLGRVVLTITVLINITNAYFCSRLRVKYSPGERYLSVDGKQMEISLYWGSDPSHAASALFLAMLRHAHGYKHIHLQKSDHSLIQVAASVPFESAGVYDDAILALSTAWDPEQASFRSVTPGDTSGLAGPRLQEIGVSGIPSQLRLHAYLADDFRRASQCHNIAQWNFYTNPSAIVDCGFNIGGDHMDKAIVYQLDSSHRTETIIEKFEARANASRMLLQFEKLNHRSFYQMLRANNKSFLFIDYDMWADERHIAIVQVPPCLPIEGHKCIQDLDNSVAMRVAEVRLFAEHAPELFVLARTFRPPLESLKFIMERTANDESINTEEAACEWALHNDAIVNEWVQEYKPSKKKFEIQVFWCDVRVTRDIRKNFSHDLKHEIHKHFKLDFIASLRHYYDNCSDINHIKAEINYYMSHGIKQRLIGAVVGGANTITDEVAKALDGHNIPVLLYDAAPGDVDSTTSVWLSTGRLLHMALAMKQFFHDNNWNRTAVLSEPTATANRFIKDIEHIGGFVLGNHNVKQHLSRLDAEKILKQLKAENARIIIVNTNYEDALTILLAAVNLNMNAADEYAWITREWLPNELTMNIKHFTFSFSCPSGDDVSSANNWVSLRRKMDKIWPARSWPSQVGAVTNAILTMVKGFQDVLQKNPQARNDLHSEQAIQEFQKSFVDLSPIQGLTQNLMYKGHTLEEATVFLEEWRGSNRETLARWRVNATAGTASPEFLYRGAYSQDAQPPHDGSSACIVSVGDPYLPTCYDTLWVVGLLCVILALVGLVMLNRVIRRHFEKRQKKILLELLAKRQERATALSAGYLVDRSELELRTDLGSGRFGCVRLAVLRVAGRKSLFVAAKTLRDDQDESEILREACTLASLDHENIIRLVGVCIDEQPPVVLMEVAFFGDLHQYLRDRQYLAEGVACNSKAIFDSSSEEAAHVSPEALTRLARQAASALDYLYLRGVIHRDLRASNCLVDASRSLKLADFGLARETKGKGVDGGGEYACRRRGLFPVLWMAPESLLHGIFSTASDMWAFGVLVFELVTLGARPYGDMSPQCVLQFVSEGGEPWMPNNATSQTIDLTRWCWNRVPDERPSAAEVVAFLTERPYALRPALGCDHDQPIEGDSDSAYGESPVSETLLPC